MKAFRHAVFVLLVAVIARADDQSRFKAVLVGTEETPAIYTAGSGTLAARIVDNDNRIEFTLTYENLSGPPSAAHVHFGQRGYPGGVSFFFCGGGKPPCPASNSGVVIGTVVAADVVGPAAQGITLGNLAAIIAEIRAGLAYANMHTAKYPGGEIRGQIRARDGDRGHDD
jgi:hypothetical protein